MAKRPSAFPADARRHEFTARLDKERAYITSIKHKIERANDSQSGAELEAEQKHVSEQLASALEERREVDAAASRFARSSAISGCVRVP